MGLNVEYLDLKSKIPGIRKQVSRALDLCRDVKTGSDVIMERVNENKSATTVLEKWQKTYAEPLEKRMKIAEEESEFLKQNSYGIATDVAIGAAVNLDARVKKIVMYRGMNALFKLIIFNIYHFLWK